MPKNSAPSTAATPSSLGKTVDRLRSVRSRFRSNQHVAAHDDDGDVEVRKSLRSKLKATGLVPTGKAKLIEDAAGLEKLCKQLVAPGEDGSTPVFAYDTEFIGENTYYPKLCLVQVATRTSIALIDPLAVEDLTPFWELLGNPDVRKILHAGEQDLEPAVRQANVDPVNVLDTQIAAGFCSLPYPASLAKLVEFITTDTLGTGIRLGKGLTFTQWDQRPLSGKQLAYAADDVRYLLLIADWIDRQLEDDDERREWMKAECAAACERARTNALEDPWERVKGIGALDGRQQAIARALAVWRDAAAKAEDLPPRVLVRDEVLINLARRPVREAEQLFNVKYLPRPVVERFGVAMIEAISEGQGAEPVELRPRGEEPTLADKFAADAAWALLQTIGHARGIDPNLLASRRETELLVRRVVADKPIDRHPLMTGWRKDAAGSRLVDLLDGDGELTLKWNL